MNGYEIIQELYKGVKEICKVTGVGAVIINQFNREGVAAAYAGKRILAGHIEGGQIIERHSDYDIVMCMTEDQEVAHRRTLSTVKKRAAAGFWNVPFIVDLSVSIFKQIKDDAA
jgi:flagellar basal body P-ring protein FlgI